MYHLWVTQNGKRKAIVRARPLHESMNSARFLVDTIASVDKVEVSRISDGAVVFSIANARNGKVQYV